MDNRELASIEKEWWKVNNAIYDCQTMKMTELVGFYPRYIGDGAIINNLAIVASILQRDLRKKHDEVDRLKAENAELLKEVTNM